MGGGVNLPAWTVLKEPVTTIDQKNIVLTDRNVPSNDSVLEFDDDSAELATVQYRSGTTAVLQERGYLETEPATHNAGIRVIFDNPYPKHLLLQSLQALIAQLYGFGLYRRRFATGYTFNAHTPLVLPADAKDVQANIWWRSGTKWLKLRKGTEFEVIQEAVPIEIQFWGYGATGSELRIPYKAEFGIPTALTDDLDTLGVPSSLQHDLATGLAARVLAGKDVPEATAEHIRRQLANQASPVGTRMSVSRALWQMFQNSIALERGRLLEAAPPQIVYQ